MKQKLFTLLLAVAASMGTMFAYVSVTIDGWSYNLEIDQTATFFGKYNASGDVIIPASVNYNNVTYKVTSIGGSAFEGCSGLTSVTIPNSVTRIGNNVFYNCTGLTSVTIGDSVTSIGNYAFYQCRRLTSIEIPNSVTSIGSSAFRYCSGLASIEIPNSVTSIGESAFNRCIGLTGNLIIPNSVTSIEDYAFDSCLYIESIHFGSELKTIGMSAFRWCKRVAEITCLADVTPTVNSNGLSGINSNAILYVPASCLQKYRVDTNWNRFDIRPLSTTDVLDPEQGVTIEAGKNTATFTWVRNNDAELYKLVITKDGETICTLLFDGNGQLESISFAPSRDGQSQAPAAIMTAAGMQFTVTGLSYATRYNYSLTIKDGSARVLASYSGSFGTTGAPQGIEETSSDQVQRTKFLHDGQVLIQKGDKTYTVTGQEVR